MTTDTNSSLSAGAFEKLLNKLIAAHEGIKPEDVTLEYIREQRRRRIYPDAHYDSEDGLASLSLRELDLLEEYVDQRMKQL